MTFSAKYSKISSFAKKSAELQKHQQDCKNATKIVKTPTELQKRQQNCKNTSNNYFWYFRYSERLIINLAGIFKILCYFYNYIYVLAILLVFLQFCWCFYNLAGVFAILLIFYYLCWFFIICADFYAFLLPNKFCSFIYLNRFVMYLAVGWFDLIIF